MMTPMCSLSLVVFLCCLSQINTSCLNDENTKNIWVNDVTKLKNLQSNRINLDLSNGNLTDITYIVKMIKESGVGNQIMLLDISNNFIHLLSDILQDLPNVKSLNISNNNLSSLPQDTFIHNQCLEILDISFNKLEYLPSELLESKDKLVSFDASHNKIKDMGLRLFHNGLINLKQVNISYNDLEYFEPWPYSINRTEYLSTLGFAFNLSHNKIREFSNKMEYYLDHEQPFFVDLNFNNFSRLSLEDFKRLFKPTVNFTEYNLAQLNFEMRYNPWICDCEMHPFVTSFVNSFLRTSKVLAESIYCASPPSLAGKSFAYLVDNPHVLVCDIKHNCPDRCVCEDRPDGKHILIDCSHTNRVTMPLNLPKHSKSSPNSSVNLTIDLSHNKINNMIWTYYTQNIIHLNISSNVIDKIEPKFLKYALSKLKLDIRYNKIKSLPNSIQKFQYNNFYYDHNPLHCNCDFLWFNNWVRLHSKHNNYTCTVGNEIRYIKAVTYNSLHCYTDLAIILCVIFIPAFVIVVSAVLVYQKWSYETKVIISQIVSKCSMNLDKSEKSFHKYDVYISSNVENTDTRLWIKDRLLKQLDTYGLKVYYPPRNNPADGCIIDVMMENISMSRKFLIILDESYLNSGWCIEEFDQAHQNMCDVNKRKIIVFVCSDNIDLEDIQQESLKTYIKHEQFIKHDDFLCWQKLRYEIFNECKEDKEVKVTQA